MEGGSLLQPVLNGIGHTAANGAAGIDLMDPGIIQFPQGAEKAAAYIRGRYQPGDRVLCFEEELPLFTGCDPLTYGRIADLESLSAGLFAALRELDDPAVQKVYARCPEGGGIAYAIQNRLKKAAAFQVINAEEAL